MKIESLFKSTQIKYIINQNIVDEDVVLATDSRKLEDSNVFVAISGENFDAFDFRVQICQSQIKVFVFEDKDERKQIVEKLSKEHVNIIFIGVENSIIYLQETAMLWIKKWKSSGGIVLGLTGSNGKTTTKEILFQFAQEIYKERTLCTNGNLNNHIGVPMTVFRIKDSHKFVIIEMGTNHPGEIEVLCNIAMPEYGLITNVGAAHLEFFKNTDGVYEEKTAVFRYIRENGGAFFVNTLDEKLIQLQNEVNVKNYRQQEQSLKNEHIKEEFNIHNLNFSYFVMSQIHPEKKDDLDRIYSQIKLPNNKRSQWEKRDNKLIFLDAYNANPSSMKASILSFINDSRIEIDNAVFICGDMNELGPEAKNFHQAIGKILKEQKAMNVHFVGRYSKYYAEGYGSGAKCYETKEELVKNYKIITNNSKFIFIKASRSLQLESLLDIN